MTGRTTSCGRWLCADRSEAETLNRQVQGGRSLHKKNETHKCLAFLSVRMTGIEPARSPTRS